MESFYRLLTGRIKESPPKLHVGSAFKSLISGKIHHVAWADEEADLWWIIASDSRYGNLGKLGPWESYITTTTGTSGTPGNNPEWKVGDTLKQRHGPIHTVLATADKCVLLRRFGAERPFAEPNDNLTKYYQRVVEPPKGFDF